MKKLDKMSRTVGYLEKLYRLINERWFEGALSMPVITVQSTPSAYGHITVSKTWKRGEDHTYELNIGAGTLDRPIEETCATLCHEMCHQYNLDNGIKDTSRGYTYHNKAFKECAEKRGLIIEHHKQYGWTITKPSDEMLLFCIENDLNEILINREEAIGYGGRGSGGGGSTSGGVTGTSKKKSSTRKYICPCCKNSCRATKDLNLICGDCNETMIKEV